VHRVLRWLGNAIAALAALVLIAAATVYALSERVIRRTYDEPLLSIPIPTDSASIAEGGRIALIHGCRGCHARDMSGQVWEDDFWFGRQNAPNLTEAAQNYSDAELVRIVRRGVRPNGRSVWSMTSEMFAPLSDADLGRIIAYIRSAPPIAGLPRLFAPGPLARWEIVQGDYRPAAELVWEADSVTAAGYFPVAGAAHGLGAYLARTSCPECHNLSLQGYPGDTPDLAIAAGYTPEQFAHFFATGEALGGRELELMSVMARNRFSHFTDDEEAALYAYLLERAQKVQVRE
jgi:cytochrome c553